MNITATEVRLRQIQYEEGQRDLFNLAKRLGTLPKQIMTTDTQIIFKEYGIDFENDPEAIDKLIMAIGVEEDDERLVGDSEEPANGTHSKDRM